MQHQFRQGMHEMMKKLITSKTNIPTSSCQRFDEWFGQQLQTNKSNDKKCN